MENTIEKKHEWYGLSTSERENIILELQEKSYTVDMLNNYFDVRSDRVIRDFMNTRGYSCRNGYFVRKQKIEKQSSETNPAVKKKIEKLEEENKVLLEKQKELLKMISNYKEKEDKQLDQSNKMLDIIKEYQDKDKENQNQLVSLMNDDKAKNERVLSIIEYYMAQTAKIQNNPQAAIAMATEEDIKKEEAIDVTSSTLPIPVKPDDYVERKTVRVSYRIYNNFNDLCKEKFSKYKQQDLVSLALQMFIDKYK